MGADVFTIDEEKSTTSDGKGNQGQNVSSLHRWLLLMVVVLVITSAVFLGLFVHYYTKYDNRKSAVSSVNQYDETKPTTEKLPTSSNEICETKECFYLANDMLYEMDLNMDPCDDFYQYSCGSFISRNYGVKENFMTLLESAMNKKMLEILTEDQEQQQPDYMKTVKNFYNWCLTNGTTEYPGNPLSTEDWPTVNRNWTEDNFDLDSLLVKTAQEFIFIPFAVATGHEIAANRTGILLIPTDFSTTEDQYVELAIQYGADEEVARKDAQEVLQLEMEMTEKATNMLYELNFSKLIKPVTLKELSEEFNYVNISLALLTAFNTAEVSLDPQQQIMINDLNYFNNLDDVLRSAPKRAVQNMFEVEYARRQKFHLDDVGEITRDDTMKNFVAIDSAMSGVSTPSIVSSCLKETLTIFKEGMTKQFLERSSFPFQEIKEEMYAMKDQMKEEMTDILTDNKWLSATSKKVALEKVAKMHAFLVSPDTVMTDEELNEFYQPYKEMEGMTYQEYLFQLNRLTAIDTFRKVGQPLRPVTVFGQIAAHFHTNNRIEISAGMFDYPLYHPDYTTAMKFGAMGFIMGHEIAHGFDASGIQFNSDAELQPWLTEDDRETFVEKSECFIGQYSNFSLTFGSQSLYEAATLSQSENMADNYGIKLSYWAYKEHVKKNGEESKLPGLELNNDQLFFLAFGQAMCSTDTLSGKVVLLRYSRYTLNHYRVLGSLRNFPEFAIAFQCPVGSKMNPEVKCSMWD